MCNALESERLAYGFPKFLAFMKGGKLANLSPSLFGNLCLARAQLCILLFGLSLLWCSSSMGTGKSVCKAFRPRSFLTLLVWHRQTKEHQDLKLYTNHCHGGMLGEDVQ